MSGASTSAASGLQRPRRRPGENRAGLLAAGTVEFGIHGYAAAQTGAIARRAGVSQPNVYANFASKRELFLACVGELHSAVQRSDPHNTYGDGDADRVDAPRDEVEPQDTRLHERASRSGEPHITLSDEHTLLLYQAIAVMGDPQLMVELHPTITHLRLALGAAAYERAILRAADLLTTLR